MTDLSDEAALLIAFNLGEVWVGTAVHHNLIQHLILLPLHGLAVAKHFTEQPHPQCHVHPTHLPAPKDPLADKQASLSAADVHHQRLSCQLNSGADDAHQQQTEGLVGLPAGLRGRECAVYQQVLGLLAM